MSLKEAKEILATHNDWRYSEGIMLPHVQLHEAIDTVIAALDKIEADKLKTN